MSSESIPLRSLGSRVVGAIALGGARWSLADPPDEALAEATIRTALDEGVTLFDTARAYTTIHHPSHNEVFLGSVLADQLGSGLGVVSTKGGHGRLPDGSFYVDGRPETLRRHCDESLRFLGIERIPLYSLHWPDPDVPLSESVGTLAELRAEGKVEMVGLCNVTTDELLALEAPNIDAVQHRFGPLDQSNRPLVEACAARGLPFLAYSPFGGAKGAPGLGKHPGVAAVSAAKEATPYQVAVAWLLSHTNVIPIVGAGRPSSIAGLWAGIELSKEEIATVDDPDGPDGIH